MTDDFSPFFPISLHALDGGFRLPLSKLGVDLCCHMRVNPRQLHPNTWRYITAHVLRSQELGRPVTFEDLAVVHASGSVPSENGLYVIKSAIKGKWRHPDSIADWRRKWLLVRPPVGVPFPVSFGVARRLEVPLRTHPGSRDRPTAVGSGFLRPLPGGLGDEPRTLPPL